MYKSNRIDIRNWISSKNEEFKHTITPLSEYVKKGVVSQASFYINNENVSNDSIQNLFGLKTFHEINVAESKYMEVFNIQHSDLFNGTYPGLYEKIEASKRVLSFRKKYMLDKISYDFDMNQGMIYSFFSNIYVKSKIEQEADEVSSKFIEQLSLINKIGNKGISEYNRFLLTVDSKVSKSKNRSFSDLLSILEEAAHQLKEKLDTSIEIFDVPQK